MYLLINNKKYKVGKRIVETDSIIYLSVPSKPTEISGKIQMCRDDGFVLSEDESDAYARKEYSGTRLVLTNKPKVAPAPVTDAEPTADEVLDALLGVTE